MILWLPISFPQASLKFSAGVNIRFGVLHDLDKGVQPTAVTSGFAFHCTLGFLVSWGQGGHLKKNGGQSPPLRDSLSDVDIDRVDYLQYFYHSRGLS